jgi:hypothetical protein
MLQVGSIPSAKGSERGLATRAMPEERMGIGPSEDGAEVLVHHGKRFTRAGGLAVLVGRLFVPESDFNVVSIVIHDIV